MNKSSQRRPQLSIALLGILVAILILTAADTSTLPAPPVAKKVPKVTEIKGRKYLR
jgi:hypothetical protein